MEHRITVEEGEGSIRYCSLRHDGTDYDLLRAVIDYLVHGISFTDDKVSIKVTVEKI